MKRILAILVLSAACGFALQAGAQQGGMGIPGENPSAGETAPQSVTPEVPSGPEGRAEDLRLHGNCEEALPIFRELAARGAGFEIARYNLGLCLFDLAKVEPDAQRAASLRRDGAANVRKAADGGLPGAQLKLVSLYLDANGVAGDPVEAGMWSLIYHANGTREVLGLPDISPDLQARLDAVLTAKTWAEAQSRANAWSPISQYSKFDNE
jgi:hypothetical protein